MHIDIGYPVIVIKFYYAIFIEIDHDTIFLVEKWWGLLKRLELHVLVHRGSYR